MEHKKLINLLGLVAVLLTLTGATIRIGHLFDNSSIGLILTVAGLILLTIMYLLNFIQTRQVKQRNEERER